MARIAFGKSLSPSFACLFLTTALSGSGCSSSQSAARSADDETSDESPGGASEVGESASEGDADETAEGPDCSDGTCFSCGEGMCPTGFYCDEEAQGGPACSWLPDCAENADCSCVKSALGSACECEEYGDGGPHVTCS